MTALADTVVDTVSAWRGTERGKEERSMVGKDSFDVRWLAADHFS